MKSFEELKYCIITDYYRYYGRFNNLAMLKELIFGIGFKYSFWFRLSKYFGEKSSLWFPLFVISRLMLNRYTFKYGIQIGWTAEIGPGFYIGHFGGIVVSGYAVIGRNCNISQGVTIGKVDRGKRAGVPIIGDNVYIGPGAKITGNVKVGNNAVVGPNSVVTRDVPEKAIVVGIPAEVISLNGEGYVSKVDYDQIIKGNNKN